MKKNKKIKSNQKEVKKVSTEVIKVEAVTKEVVKVEVKPVAVVAVIEKTSLIEEKEVVFETTIFSDADSKENKRKIEAFVEL